MVSRWLGEWVECFRRVTRFGGIRMPYYYGYGFGIDPLYLVVVLICTVLGLAAQSYINST